MTIIFYAYHETESCRYNLSYFLKHALLPDYQYVFIVNGRNCTIAFPYRTNVRVMYRENEGFDFGGYQHALDKLGHDDLSRQHEFFVFMNASVIGPLFRDGSLENDWVALFQDRFRQDASVRLLGTTIVCLPRTDAGGYGPRVEGFFFCTDREGLARLLAEPRIFYQHPTKESAILDGEYGLSRCMLRHGHNIGCMLERYQGIDWRQKKYWGMNENRHPSRAGSYFGGTIDPFEVVFHKWFWHGMPLVNDKIVHDHVRAREQFYFISPNE